MQFCEVCDEEMEPDSGGGYDANRRCPCTDDEGVVIEHHRRCNPYGLKEERRAEAREEYDD